MNAFIEPCGEWIESVMGCARSDSVTQEVEVPFGHLVAEEILKGVSLDRQYLVGADVLRPLVQRWELPPSVATRLRNCLSRHPIGRPRSSFSKIWTDFMEVKMRGRTGPESPCSIKRWLDRLGCSMHAFFNPRNWPKKLKTNAQGCCGYLPLMEATQLTQVDASLDQRAIPCSG